MTLTEISICYIACGSPFGVFYLIHNFYKKSGLSLFILSIAAVCFWVVFAIKLLFEYFSTKTKPIGSDEISFDNQIARIEKLFCLNLSLEKTNISLFDLRETFRRYVGLTSSLRLNTNFKENASEFSRFIDAQSKENSRICRERRNHGLIIHQQTIARGDFLDLIQKGNTQDNEILVADLANLLDDRQLLLTFQEINIDTASRFERKEWDQLEGDQIAA